MKIDKIKLDLVLAKNCLSYAQLSEICGVSQITIIRITKGTQIARPATIGKIAKALDCDVKELLKD